MSNPTVSTTSIPQAPQLNPQSSNYCFYAPRTEGASYPPYSLCAAERLLHQAKAIPPSLTFFDEDLLGDVYRAREHTDAATTLAGLLYRALEQEGSKSLGLARALCLALAEANYGVEMTGERLRKAILKALGQEVR